MVVNCFFVVVNCFLVVVNWFLCGYELVFLFHGSLLIGTGCGFGPGLYGFKLVLAWGPWIHRATMSYIYVL